MYSYIEKYSVAQQTELFPNKFLWTFVLSCFAIPIANNVQIVSKNKRKKKKIPYEYNCNKEIQLQ